MFSNSGYYGKIKKFLLPKDNNKHSLMFQLRGKGVFVKRTYNQEVNDEINNVLTGMQSDGYEILAFNILPYSNVDAVYHQVSILYK